MFQTAGPLGHLGLQGFNWSSNLPISYYVRPQLSINVCENRLPEADWVEMPFFKAMTCHISKSNAKSNGYLKANYAEHIHAKGGRWTQPGQFTNYLFLKRNIENHRPYGCLWEERSKSAWGFLKKWALAHRAQALPVLLMSQMFPFWWWWPSATPTCRTCKDSSHTHR